MIKYYKTENNSIVEIDAAEPGCWVSVIAPDEHEISRIISDFELDAGFVRSALDEEESARIETEDDQTLVIIDYPIAEKSPEEENMNYYTMPMGIILTNSYVVTISLRDNTIISEMTSGVVKNLQTHLKTRFILMMLLRIAARYLQYLKQIDKISYHTEKNLHKSMKNEELIQMLGLEKSLVYFSTSLKSNEVVLEKILRGRIIKLYEEDQDLLEDVLIEIKQAIEMANIYSSILSGMMDAFASVISNNVNVVMKRLTIITIIMAIPTIIFSYYGMNMGVYPIPGTWFPLVLAIIATAAAALILLKTGK